jgi:hypothetical protein
LCRSAGAIELAQQRVEEDVVDEGTLAVDLDDRQPLAIASLEVGIAADVNLDELELALCARLLQHRARPLAEVAPLRMKEDDARRYG